MVLDCVVVACVVVKDCLPPFSFSHTHPPLMCLLSVSLLVGWWVWSRVSRCVAVFLARQQLNIASPSTGSQMFIEIDDEKKL